MTLKERLVFDMKTAMKVQDKAGVAVIRMVRAAILQVEKDQMRQLSDDDVLQIFVKEIKQRKDVIEEIGEARPEYAVGLADEITILMNYLPKQLTAEEIRELVVQTVNQTGATGAKDTGRVMAALMPLVKGKADGKTVSQMVKEVLLSL
jgi:uncharacterized protein YqeY